VHAPGQAKDKKETKLRKPASKSKHGRAEIQVYVPKGRRKLLEESAKLCTKSENIPAPSVNESGDGSVVELNPVENLPADDWESEYDKSVGIEPANGGRQHEQERAVPAVVGHTGSTSDEHTIETKGSIPCAENDHIDNSTSASYQHQSTPSPSSGLKNQQEAMETEESLPDGDDPDLNNSAISENVVTSAAVSGNDISMIENNSDTGVFAPSAIAAAVENDNDICLAVSSDSSVEGVKDDTADCVGKEGTGDTISAANMSIAEFESCVQTTQNQEASELQLGEKEILMESTSESTENLGCASSELVQDTSHIPLASPAPATSCENLFTPPDADAGSQQVPAPCVDSSESLILTDSSGGSLDNDNKLEKTHAENVMMELEEKPTEMKSELNSVNACDSSTKEAAIITDSCDKKENGDNDKQKVAPAENEKNSKEEEEEDEDSWDKIFDDNGDCLDPSAMEEVRVLFFNMHMLQ
jgi:hypothetical protein